MNHPYDPETLAQRLDEIFEGIQSGILPDDPLLEAAMRLSNAPLPQPDAAAKARIQQRVFESLSTTPPATNGSGILIIGGASLVIVIVLAVVLAVFSNSGITRPSDAPAQEDFLLPQPTEIIATASQTPSLTVTLSPTATATLTETATMTATPTASPPPTETPLPIVMIIEGPVDHIGEGVISIYGIEVSLNPDDPLLKALRVGDVVRIEAGIAAPQAEIEEAPVLTSVTVQITNVEVYVDESGAVFRDDNDCNNPPPAWAPALGWRARCEAAPPPDGGNNNNNVEEPGNSNPGNGNQGRGNNSGRGNQNNNGKNDDDDDDDD